MLKTVLQRKLHKAEDWHECSQQVRASLLSVFRRCAAICFASNFSSDRQLPDTILFGWGLQVASLCNFYLQFLFTAVIGEHTLQLHCKNESPYGGLSGLQYIGDQSIEFMGRRCIADAASTWSTLSSKLQFSQTLGFVEVETDEMYFFHRLKEIRIWFSGFPSNQLIDHPHSR